METHLEVRQAAVVMSEVLGVREEHSSQGTSHRFSGTVCGCMQHASIYLSISLKKGNSFCHAGHQTGTQCWGNEQ